MKTVLALPQLTDQRGHLPSKGSYVRRNTPLKDCIRGWHHSLTKKAMSGSTAVGFSNYHVYSLGWPAIGYHLVIEPQHIIDTPKGKRARIVYAVDVSLRSYHVGDSNDFAVGICVAGDYRTEKLDDATKATIDELQAALVADGIGKSDQSHHEFKGYSWKACCVFDLEETFKFLNKVPVSELPETYKIQQGDTLWGLANNDPRFTVEDLKKWNNISDASQIQVGDILRLKAPTSTIPKVNATQVKWSGIVKVAELNVRKGPGVTYPSVTKIRKGTEVPVYDEKGGWLYIGNGQWVSNVDGQYIAQKPKTHPLAGKRLEAIAAKVNFYDTPRWSNPSGQFLKGQGFTIIDRIITEGAPQYKVKNSNGYVYYTTAREDLVKVI